MQEAVKGCEGVAQIKDNILFNSIEETHGGRLWTVLYRLQEARFTLRWVKCELGMTEVEWFGNRFLGARMRVAADKAKIIQHWPRPVTVRGVKSFLTMLQFNTVYQVAENGEKTLSQILSANFGRRLFGK